MGGTPVTQQKAEDALKKLKARQITRVGAHPKYAIYNGAKLVAKTGLRHSSNRDIPVPHVKRDLRVSAQFVLDLAHCPKSKDDWLKEIGEVPAA